MQPVAPAPDQDRFSPEKALLLACCRHRLGLSTAIEIPAHPDWRLFAALARAHGIFAMAADSLLRDAKDRLPDSIRGEWENFRHAELIRTIGVLKQADELLTHWSQAGIAGLLFKGPAVSQRTLKNPAMRESSDIDLLVAPEKLDAAIGAASEKGFDSTLPWTGELRACYCHNHFEWPLVHKDTQLHIDLHFRICPPWMPLPPTAGEALRMRAEMPLARCILPVPSLLHDVLIALSNGAKHGFSRLRHMMDMLLLLRSEPGLAVQVADVLRRANMKHWLNYPVARALRLRLLTEEAEKLLEEIPSQNQLPLIIRLSNPSGTLSPNPGASLCQDNLYIFAHLRTWAGRGAYVWRFFFALRPRDMAIIRLPRLLRFLYWPLRFLRLAGKGANHIVRRIAGQVA